ncbi:hypothetical protein [Streptomyces sp. NBC_00102]|uniref:hypothetical protein n=1 Tax=Streptomyces sp. NBC_00102 TaxID=2975652 RepID=UPI002254124A|nr:hypothetical protein [Streptomyces sp. NBC_00102]MCX5401191.1 hypothetical protein [Streptomyces sp. NBC_00102]
MPQVTRVDTEGLQKGADLLGPLGERLLVFVQGTLRELNSMSPEGNDKFGRQFAAKRDPLAAELGEGLESLSRLVTSIGDGLNSMVAVFDGAERNASTLTARLNSQLNEGGGNGGGRR